MNNAHVQRKEKGVADFVLMNEISENAFMKNLETRFQDNAIYTYIGDVVVSVNPYKQLPGLYEKEAMTYYKGKWSFASNLIPHVFGLTDTAYRNMQSESQDQCIIISGESGAGKTEASKRIMEYISEVAAGNGETVDRTKEMLLQSNPVLEAFGNAKTNRNDNSSRFGKYMDIQFDYKGLPCGGNIQNYLLEKARVVHQLKGERNFHIFYQILKAGPVGELGLKNDPNYYPYLNQGQSPEVRGMDDSKEFAAVKKGMGVIGFSSQEQNEIWKILSAILNLGLLQFVSDGTSADGSKVSNRTELDTVARMLQTTADKVETAVTHNTVVAGGQVVAGPLNPAKSAHSRDTLCKAMYSKLFDWIVRKINTAVAAPTTGAAAPRGVIGVLDIYGFEIMQHNSFEQFCINFCNEKLQQLFIELTLKTEQEEYRSEGITWTPIDYFNNKIICDMIEQKYGMIDWLDEQCLAPGPKDDKIWLAKLDEKFSTHAHYLSKKNSQDKTIQFNTFRLKHYAGDVDYDVTGFIEKNTDTLFKDLANLLFECGNSIMKGACPEGDKRTWKGAQKRPVTLGTGFKRSMNDLVANLLLKAPSYIRCIKPNEKKSSGMFDREMVKHQVRYLGLVENLRVRRAGFCYRSAYKRFFWRFRVLSDRFFPKFHGTDREGCQQIMQYLNIPNSAYQMGKTKIFIKDPPTVFQCEDAREKVLDVVLPKVASIIQATWRGTKIKHLVGGWQSDLLRTFNGVRQDPTWGKHTQWPQSHFMLRHAEVYLKRIHNNWRAKMMVMSLPPDEQPKMRRRAIAHRFVAGGIKPWNFNRDWAGDYLDPVKDQQFRMKLQQQMSMHGGKAITYAIEAQKVPRHAFWNQTRMIVVTDTHVYKTDKNCTVNPPGKPNAGKQAIALQDITGVSVSKGRDCFLVIHHKVPGNDVVLDLGKGAMNWERVTELLAAIYIATRDVPSRHYINVNVADSFQYNASGNPQAPVQSLTFSPLPQMRTGNASNGKFKKGPNGMNTVGVLQG